MSTYVSGGLPAKVTWQVVFIGDRPYYTTYERACSIARMKHRARRLWLQRHWRTVRPLVQRGKHFYFKSGTSEAFERVL